MLESGENKIMKEIIHILLYIFFSSAARANVARRRILILSENNAVRQFFFRIQIAR